MMRWAVLTVGSVVAGYRIERVLGSGGMGSVYFVVVVTLHIRFVHIRPSAGERAGQPMTASSGSAEQGAAALARQADRFGSF